MATSQTFAPRKNRVLGLGIGLGIISKPKPKTQKFLYPNPKPKPKTQKFLYPNPKPKPENLGTMYGYKHLPPVPTHCIVFLRKSPVLSWL